MQAWIRRARDLEIIGDDLYRTLNMGFRQTGWNRTEPFAYEGRESPALFRRLVLRALAERMIYFRRGQPALPGCLRSHGKYAGASCIPSRPGTAPS